MDEQKREIIRQYLTDAAQERDLSVQEDYSGRGMYGRQCFGIVGSFDDLMATVLTAQAYLIADDEMTPFETIPAPSRDSMGLDQIWYWPILKTDTREEG